MRTLLVSLCVFLLVCLSKADTPAPSPCERLVIEHVFAVIEFNDDRTIAYGNIFCDSGFVLANNSIPHCNRTHGWSHAPRCLESILTPPSKCPLLMIFHGHVEIVNETVNVTCDAGTTLSSIVRPICHMLPSRFRCGGLTDITCPAGYYCTDDPNNACDSTSTTPCNRMCVDYVWSRVPICLVSYTQCPPLNIEHGRVNHENHDPFGTNIECDSGRSLHNGRPMCELAPPAPSNSTTCGGMSALPCPIGEICIDNPMNRCHHRGEADCIGFCVRHRWSHMPSCTAP